MRYEELTEYTTTDGYEIEFTFLENYEPPSRGFVRHAILASIQNQVVGYLRITYIPHNIFEKLYPTWFHYKKHIAGGGHLLKFDDDSITKILLGDNLKDILMLYSAGNVISDHFYRAGIESLNKYNDRDLAKMVREAEKMLHRNEMVTFNWFKEFQVDKPYPEYSRVAQQGENFARKDRFSMSADKTWDKQNIGTSMYFAMVNELNKRYGLTLWASSIQSESATALWNRFERMGLVKHYSVNKPGTGLIERRYLDPTKIPDDY